MDKQSHRDIMNMEIMLGLDSYGQPYGEEHPLLRGPNIRGTARTGPTKYQERDIDATIGNILLDECILPDGSRLISTVVLDLNTHEIKYENPKERAREVVSKLASLIKYRAEMKT